MSTELTERIRQFVSKNFYVPDPSVLVNETSLLDQGIVDSTGVLDVVAFIEDEFGVRVEDNEMLPDNLDSIANIARFIERKRRGI